MIYAEKEGKTAKFSQAAWDLLTEQPDGTRDGWREVPANAPKEVQQAIEQTARRGRKEKGENEKQNED